MKKKKEEKKATYLAIALTLLGIFLLVGIVTTSGSINKKLQKDNLITTFSLLGVQSYHFTIKIYASDGTSYRGKCSYDGTHWEWTSWGNKTYEGDSISCYYYFTKWDPGYLKLEIYTNGKLTHSKKVSSSTSSPIKISHTELNPALKTLILLELIMPTNILNLIPGILMIAGGAIGIGISIAIYKGISLPYSKGWATYPSYRTGYKRYRPAPRYRRRRKPVISNCPACKAPLRTKPPCECEYCGTMVY